MKFKRILALGALLIEAGFLIWMVIAAMTATPEKGNSFNAAIFAAILFPVMIYVYLWVAKFLRGRGVDKEQEEEKNK